MSGNGESRAGEGPTIHFEPSGDSGATTDAEGVRGDSGAVPELFRFRVPGHPLTWKRTNQSGHRRRMDPEMRWHQQLIAQLAAYAAPRTRLDIPIRVDCTFVFPRPTRRPTGVPPGVWADGCRIKRPVDGDIDNLWKMVLDGLEKSDRITNDRIVVEGCPRKLWGAEGEKPHTLVVVSSAGWS